ncbi:MULTISPECIES: hypothetical protein [Rhizobium]|uniref:Uncharacterized protein n=1 Tax=Rhizobium miluonense TaxID=411945 RepID=A0A1C3WWE4_9HYPH|nr:hypothetical protein [Rhizobium miluonense]SCB44275.1 hypothetical protein GA0061102_104327 [Rhizobium miluonense]
MANFLEKWSSKKADKPKTGMRSAIDTFRGRIAEQKAYLEEFERDAAGFNKWRSTWFQRVPGGFGVTIGRDAVNAGEGLSYIVVETVSQVAEFLDDLAQHAENDVAFQQALEENRLRRAALLNAAKSKVKAPASRPAASKSASIKTAGAKAAAATTDADKPKRGRKPQA